MVVECDKCKRQMAGNNLPPGWARVEITGTCTNMAKSAVLCDACCQRLIRWISPEWAERITGSTPAPEPVPASLLDLKYLAAQESGYRRGVAQALSWAGDHVRGGGTADDLDQLTDLSTDWQHDHKPHPAYLDQLWAAWRQGECGKTGIDPRLLGITRGGAGVTP